MKIKDLVDLENNLTICDGCKKRIGELDLPDTQKDKEISELVDALKTAQDRFTNPKYGCEWEDASDDIEQVLNKYKTINE